MRPDGRYAPSPTGRLHLGNLRTAAVAWLYARAQSARFLVRVEDLDRGRVREPYVAEQLDDLARLGLDWDGEVVRQSSRTALYDAALRRLDAAGRLYECFCTRAEVREAASAPHGPLPEGHYPGTCRELTPADRDRHRGTGRSPALRVRADGARLNFVDRIAGPGGGTVDDFVVRRADGAHAYNLAVVVDDAEQGVGEVVRGADLLESVPRQRWLAGALGVPPPASCAHVPLVLGPDGTRLAKRHGAVDLDGAGGPEAVVGWIAGSLGLGPARSLAALLPRFDPAAFSSRAGVEPTRWAEPPSSTCRTVSQPGG